MAKEQSQLSPWKSRFAPDTWLNGAQYLAENMVARQARRDGGELPQYFWNLDKWKREFLLQLRHAHSLLKLYSVEAVVKALRTKKGQRVYSLGAKFILDHLVKDEQRKLDVQQAVEPMKPKVEVPAETPEGEQVRPAFVPNNQLSKLKGL